MRMICREYILNEAAIDTVSSDVQDYLKKINTESRSVQRIRLTVEEILLNILTHFGGIKIRVGLGKRFGRHMFNLRYEAAPFDPSKSGDDPLVEDIMRSLGLYPAWSCRGRSNTVSLVLSDRQKRSMLFYILLAALAAAVLGALGNVIPESVRLIVSDSLLAPAANCFMGVLNTFAGVMIFLTICSGILGMGDPAALGRIGKSVVARFIGISFAVSAVSAIVVLPFVDLNFSAGAGEQMSTFEQISGMFFDILPSNITDPFRTGNTLHIIVIAAFTGCALLAVGERASRVRELTGEFAALFQQTVSIVCAFLPLFVFSMLLRLIWSGQAGVLISLLKPILLIAVMIVILAVISLVISSLRLKCPPMLLMKKVLPAFLVAFTSASSVSAFQIGMETCEKKLGVNKNTASFVYPLGSVIYMPSSVIYFTVLVCVLAESYQIAVSIPWLVMAAAISTLITIAMPPVPGSDILCYTVLFSCLGIPAEALFPAAAVGIVFDYLNTGTDVMLVILRIACEAKRLGKLDRAILLSK